MLASWRGLQKPRQGSIAIPNVLDEFVVKFSLDPSAFTEGQRQFLESIRRTSDDAKKFGDAVESQSKKVFEFFGDLKRAALGVTGLLLGGLGVKEFAGFLTNLDAATARTARTMDISARELSNWQGAAEQLGGTAEGITGTLQGLSSEMNKFALTGQTGLLGPLTQLGVSLYSANGQMKTSTELMLDLADAVQGMDPAKARAFLSLIGADQGAINLMINGRQALQGYLDAADRAGSTTRESAAAAAEYQRQLALVERSATGLGRSLFTTLAPALTTVLEKLTSIATKLREGFIDTPEQKAEETVDPQWKRLLRSLIWGTSFALPFLPRSAVSGLSDLLLGPQVSAQDRASAAATARLNETQGRTRGDRNNNPGNIKMGPVARAFGAVSQDEQGHAIFPTWEAGNAAQAELLRRSYSGMTVPEMGAKYAEDPNWAAGVMRYGGYGPGEVPNLSDPAQMQRLQSAIRRQEGTHAPPSIQSAPLPILPIGAPAAAAVQHSSMIDNSRRDSNTRTVSVETGDIHIDARGGDAHGIASGIDAELRRQAAIGSWNTGLA